MKAVYLCVGLALLCGCASIDSRLSYKHCKADTPVDCEPHQFAAASESVLRTNGPSIRIDCPTHFYSPPEEEIRPECVALVEAALTLLNHRLADRLSPVETSQVQYRYHGGCYDTFISGREQADCYSVIRATVPMRWLEAVKPDPQARD